MKGFMNMKIGAKLLTGFILVAMLAGVMGLVAINDIRTLDDADTLMYETMAVPLAEMGTISTAFQRIRVNIRDMLLADDEALHEALHADMMQRIEERFKELETLSASYATTIQSDEMKALWVRYEAAMSEFRKQTNATVAMADNGQMAEAIASMADQGPAGIASREYQDIIAEIVASKVEDTKILSADNTALANRSTTTMIIVLAVAMFLAVGLGLLLSSLISNPLKKALVMIQELGKGHLGMRLHMTSRDEVGLMAQAMDEFADVLQNKMVQVIQMIAAGDVSAVVVPFDDKDEIAPALQTCIKNIKALVADADLLVVATVEGRLDTRADATKHGGDFRKIIEGVNHTLDAVIGPLNVAAEYVDRISKGDIPPKITDRYHGDFNEIKNNLNVCIDAINLLVADAGALVQSATLGQLDTRADAAKHGGDFAKIVKGVNQTLDVLVGHIDSLPSPVMIIDKDFNIRYMNKLGAKIVGSSQKQLIGQKCYDNFKTGQCRTANCACSMAMSQGREVTQQTDARPNGMNLEIEYTGIPMKDEAGQIIGALELISDQTAIKGAAKIAAKQADFQKIEVDGLITNLGKLAEGDLNIRIQERQTDNDTREVGENFRSINKSLADSVQAIQALVRDAEMLSRAAVDGKLSTRADASKHGGDFRKIVDGVNETLDAVIKPVNEASAVLKEMAVGNLQQRMMGDYKGDHAEIKNALNSTLDSLGDYVTEISAVLSEMANGNMDSQITGEYHGDFTSIKDALNLILESLNQTLGDINNASDQVAAGSRQVSDGSQALSQGATEQAASIEQLTASINDIASQTKNNALNANQANELAVAASSNAGQGNSQMQEMLKAMEDINTSSANISKIIKVIDEIAFQTNILALNAAVEAARAGQHGKGFAVVAEEVRNLAARSASAAKETTGMIEGSIQKVSAGTRIANDTASALNKIVSDVTKVADIVSSIMTASNDQATGITQINQGVEQVSRVIQTNSATSEESAAASEELSGQADLLKEMVSRFRLRQQGGMARLTGGESLRRLPGDARMDSGKASKKKDAGKPKISLNDRDFGKY